MKAIAMRFPQILAVLGGVCVLAPGAGFAEPTADPAAVIVTAMVNSLAHMLSDPKLTASDREHEFARLLDEDCDLGLVARFVLGNYFAAANEADRQQFASLFERWITHMFTGKIGGFDASSFAVKSVTHADGGSIVMTEIAAGNRPIRIDWRVNQSGSGYRIVDVAMAGISMAQVEREEIGAAIRGSGGTVAGFNRALEQRLVSNDPTTTAASTGQ